MDSRGSRLTWHAYLESKGAEYAAFDPSRMPKIFAALDCKLPKHIIQILGTNGKGSTGRFIALGLLAQDYKVLHFTSPHLHRFNERFYKNGRIVGDDELEAAHRALQEYSCVQQASYFEYATLLALVLAQDCEYFVCEAGLGGEFDSTSVLKEYVELSVFTPISYDHTEFLGNSIESIATTKLKAMSKRAFLAPQTYKEVESIAQSIAKKVDSTLTILTKDIIHSCLKAPEIQAYMRDFAPFLQENFAVAACVLAALGVDDLSNMPRFDLPARAQKIAPNVMIDVGHNAECARAIAQILGKKRINLVYNTFSQKDVREILSILKPNIDQLLICPITHTRAIPEDELLAVCAELGIAHKAFVLDCSLLQDEKEYVVFGSFSVAEAFLEMWNARG